MTRTEPNVHRRNANTAVDRAYRKIEDDILSARLAPGAMLDETALAKRLGVSRTPIREALRRLQQDGLIVKIDHRGSFVTSPSTEDIHEISAIRMMLEPVAARQAVGSVRTATLDELERRVDALTKRLNDETKDERKPWPLRDVVALDVLSLDSDIHRTVLEATGNRLLLELVMSLHNRLGAVRVRTASRRINELLREHRDLLVALRARDASAAESAMREHLKQALQSRLRLLDLPRADATNGARESVAIPVVSFGESAGLPERA